MHAAAFEWARKCSLWLPRRASVLEIGSRDVNGSVRPLFGYCPYHGIDALDGPGVDEVADAATWRPPAGRWFDTVVSTECLEHARDAAAVCRTAFEALAPAGAFILTAAAPSRPPHSGVDGGKVRPGEFYRGVSAADLRAWLAPFAVALVDDFTQPTDVYALALKLA